jgi:hypothetical protein
MKDTVVSLAWTVALAVVVAAALYFNAGGQ